MATPPFLSGMNRLHQHYFDRFQNWEWLGRGALPQALQSVSLEPPFLPSADYRPPRPTIADDGRRPTALSGFLDSAQVRAAVPQEEEEEEPEFEFDYFERSALTEISVSLPPDFSPRAETGTALLQVINQCSESVSFELYGTADAVKMQFALAESDSTLFVGSLRAFFPEAIFKVESNAVVQGVLKAIDPADARIVECALGREFVLPLATDGVDPLIGLVGALSGLSSGEFAMFQVLFQPTCHAWSDSILNSILDTEGEVLPWIPQELIKPALEKSAKSLFSAVVRLCAATKETDRLWEIVTSIAAPLHLFSNPLGNHFAPLANDEDYSLEDHLSDLLSRQSRRFGMLLDGDELLRLVHLPSAEVKSPRFSRQVMHSKAAPSTVLASSGLYLGDNEHHGINYPVHLSDDQRVRHTHIIGSSGTGKSTLLFNLIMSDIENNQGLVVLDPHGDLVDAVLAQIPDERIDEVVLLDPSDETASVAFNILSAHSDAERIMLASDLVSVFERLSSSWGDQMNIVLRNAILAFLESDRSGTLSDMRRFLIDDAFRSDFLQSVHDPDVRFYWDKTFPQFTTKQSIGAVVTRLETFLAPKPVRYIVSQEQSALDFREIMDSGKILLCRLSQGLIGKENAYLFGSLLVSKLQQTAMGRARQEESQRRSFWCYIDEFQNFITPSMAEILTEARKYRVGMVLAHQNLSQLQKQQEVASTVLAEANIRIVFRVGDHDAKTLASGFSAFEANDLQSLDRGQAIVRVERSDHDFNVAVPLRDRPSKDQAEKQRKLVTACSRTKYATPRSEIEAELLRKMGITDDTQRSQTDSQSETEARGGDRAVEPIDESSSTDSFPEPQSGSKASSPPDQHSEGKGGADHQVIQQQIKDKAQQAGYLATIEEPLPAGGSVDVAIENENRSIACEVTVTTPKAHELANIEKCLAADFDIILLVCPNRHKRKRLRNAIAKNFSADIERIHCISPSEFSRFLNDQPTAVEENDSAPPTKSKGFNLSRKFVDDDSAASKQRDHEALQNIAKLLRGE